MAKNLCGKTRSKEKPYEIWEANGWTWKVLKKYQTPEKETGNAYARWFCLVTSPFVPNGELGDVYVSEIKSNALQTYADPVVTSGS